jgi:hypothetical protein
MEKTVPANDIITLLLNEEEIRDLEDLLKRKKEKYNNARQKNSR